VTSHMGKASTVADAFENALNAHDIDGLGNLLADDVTYWEANLPGPLSGREAVKQHFRENWKSFSDSHLRLVNRVESGDWIADETEWTATHTGPINVPGQAPIPATGKRMKGMAVAVGQTREGKVHRLNIYYDNMAFMAQLGLMPGSQ